MKAKTRKAVTRKKSAPVKKVNRPQCPPKLERAMELINRVPAKREWPDVGRIMEGHEAFPTSAESFERTSQAYENAAGRIKKELPQLQVEKWRRPDAPSVVLEYFYLTAVRRILADILKSEVLAFGEVVYTYPPDWPVTEAKLTIDIDTFKIRLSTAGDEVIDTFLGADVRYIKACCMCGRAFWLNRDKRVTCSARCDARRRTRIRRGMMTPISAIDAARNERERKLEKVRAKQMAFMEPVTQAVEADKKTTEDEPTTKGKKGRK